jgi:transposase-like protein
MTTGRRLTREQRLEIRKLYHHGETPENIARRFQCTKEAVKYWIRAKRVPHPAIRLVAERRPVGKRLPVTLQHEIKALARKGKSNNEIALALGIAWTTVAAWRAKRIRLFPTEEVLALLKQRVERHQIAKIVKVPFRTVRAFARANGFGFTRPPWKPTPKQVAEIIDLALSHRYSIAAIARMNGAPYKRVLKMCHVALDCENFISGGQGVVALDSYLPSRYRSPLKPAEPKQEAVTPQQREEVALYLVDAVHRAAGRFPEDAQLLEVCILVVTTIYMRENPTAKLGPIEMKKIQNYFAPHFRTAADMLRASQSGSVN